MGQWPAEGVDQNPAGFGSAGLNAEDRAAFFHVALLHATPKMPLR